MCVYVYIWLYVQSVVEWFECPWIRVVLVAFRLQVVSLSLSLSCTYMYIFVYVCKCMCMCVCVCVCVCVYEYEWMHIYSRQRRDEFNAWGGTCCMRPEATSVSGLKLLVYQALSCCVWGLQLAAHAALNLEGSMKHVSVSTAEFAAQTLLAGTKVKKESNCSSRPYPFGIGH